jgi:LysM repeat protein
VERICPYLALADDGRTVADGFDAEHRCHALAPPAPLDRARQVQLCLTEAHARCERFAAARTAWLAASSGLPRVAPDVAFGRTRLILEPEPAWRNLAGAPAAPFNRRTILIATGGAALVALFVLGNLFGILGRAPAPGGSPSPSASVSLSLAPSPTATPAPGSAAASPSGAPTASPTLVPTPGPTPAPTPRTYVVQPNDTLNGIAARFGTTAAAIAAANGITVNTIINVGQVLIIP